MVPMKFLGANFSSKIQETKVISPGFLLAVIVGYFSFLISEIIGEDILSFEKSPISPVMLAIIIGIFASNLISIPKSFDPGLLFSGKKVLGFGIVLLGFQLSLSDIFVSGLEGIPVVLGCIIIGLGFTVSSIAFSAFLDLASSSRAFFSSSGNWTNHSSKKGRDCLCGFSDYSLWYFSYDWLSLFSKLYFCKSPNKSRLLFGDSCSRHLSSNWFSLTLCRSF